MEYEKPKRNRNVRLFLLGFNNYNLNVYFLLHMVFGNNGKIDKVMVGAVLHVVRMSFWAIMALSDMYLFDGVVVMESCNATDDKDNLAVLLVLVESGRSTRAEGRVHYFYFVINIVAGVESSFATFEIHLMDFWDSIEIYNHNVFII